MKKGFTLIELLAVIVILAIIALIAVPIVLSIIEETKESATLRNAEYYISAVENSIMKKNLSAGGSFNPSVCEVQSDGDLLCDGKDTLEIEVSGEKPTSGTIAFAQGKITNVSLTLSNKIIVKNEKGELVYQEEFDAIKLCTVNTTKPTALIWDWNQCDGCDPSQESNYTTGQVGLLASDGDAFAPGVAYTCNFIDNSETNNMTFFVLSSTEDSVTLISGANLGGTVAWSEDGSNHIDESEEAQAVTAKAALADRTSNWDKLTDEQKSAIKLPTANQIAEAAGKTFNGSSTTSELPTWLHSYTETPVACGYWTSTPVDSYPENAWHVDSSYASIVAQGDYTYTDVGTVSNMGIRPVITISKDNVKK